MTGQASKQLRTTDQLCHRIFVSSNRRWRCTVSPKTPSDGTHGEDITSNTQQQERWEDETNQDIKTPGLGKTSDGRQRRDIIDSNKSREE